jgi:hypothetical protein
MIIGITHCIRDEGEEEPYQNDRNYASKMSIIHHFDEHRVWLHMEAFRKLLHRLNDWALKAHSHEDNQVCRCNGQK